MREILGVAFRDKKVILILTHNIELLEAQKLSSSESAAIIRRIEDKDTAVDHDKQTAVYRRVEAVLENLRSDLDKVRAGEEPTGMGSHTDITNWALEFLSSLRHIVEPDA